MIITPSQDRPLPEFAPLSERGKESGKQERKRRRMKRKERREARVEALVSTRWMDRDKEWRDKER